VVQAALDWRRPGLHRPITEPELRELGASYLPAGAAPWGNDDRWTVGLSWALTGPPQAPAALLLEVQPRSAAEVRAFQVPDILVSLADAPEIPLEAWRFTLRRCDAFELMIVGETAAQHDRPDVVDLALRQGSRCAEPVVASWAGTRLGGLLTDRGDVAGAISSYRQAIADGERVTSTSGSGERNGGLRRKYEGSEMAALACVNLGHLLAEQGDIAGAIVVYRKGIAMDDPAATPLAAVNLAGLLRDRGDLAAARSAYEQALSAYAVHGDPVGIRAQAAHNLGHLLVQMGETDSALTAFRVAIDFDPRGAGARSAMQVALLLEAQGKRDGLAEALQIAATSDEPALAAFARVRLAQLVATTDPVQAEKVYREVAAVELPRVSGLALVELGGLLARRGDLVDAVQAYHQAMGDAEFASRAVVDLARLLEETGDTNDFREALRTAVTTGHREAVAMTAYSLGARLFNEGDWNGAVPILQQAVDTGHPQLTPISLVVQGDALASIGDVAGARFAYERAARSGNPKAKARALDRLRNLAG
jgi:tetratricopeptide (TPR) repeat protein